MTRPDPARLVTIRCRSCGRWIAKVRAVDGVYVVDAWRRPPADERGDRRDARFEELDAMRVAAERSGIALERGVPLDEVPLSAVYRRTGSRLGVRCQQCGSWTYETCPPAL